MPELTIDQMIKIAEAKNLLEEMDADRNRAVLHKPESERFVFNVQRKKIRMRYSIMYYQIKRTIPTWAKRRMRLPYLKNDYDIYQVFIDELVKMDNMQDWEIAQDQTDGMYEQMYKSERPMAEELEEFVTKEFELKFNIIYTDDDIYIYTKRKMTNYEQGCISGYCRGMDCVQTRLSY